MSAQYEGTMYIRLGKAGEKPIFDSGKNYTATIGELHCYQESASQNLILGTGNILHEVVGFVQENKIDTAIWSVPFVKPLDADRLCQLAAKHSNIIVMEEHQQSCGLGSAIIEKLSDSYSQGLFPTFPHIRRIAIPDLYIFTSGSQQSLRREVGLTLLPDYFV